MSISMFLTGMGSGMAFSDNTRNMECYKALWDLDRGERGSMGEQLSDFMLYTLRDPQIYYFIKRYDIDQHAKFFHKIYGIQTIPSCKKEVKGFSELYANTRIKYLDAQLEEAQKKGITKLTYPQFVEANKDKGLCKWGVNEAFKVAYYQLYLDTINHPNYFSENHPLALEKGRIIAFAKEVEKI